MLRSELIEWLIDCIDLITFPPVSDIKMKRRNDIESFFIKKKKKSQSQLQPAPAPVQMPTQASSLGIVLMSSPLPQYKMVGCAWKVWISYM